MEVWRVSTASLIETECPPNLAISSALRGYPSPLSAEDQRQWENKWQRDLRRQRGMSIIDWKIVGQSSIVETKKEAVKVGGSGVLFPSSNATR